MFIKENSLIHISFRVKEVILISVSDWLLARSQAFQFLVDKFRKHKINTKSSFRKIKEKHYHHDYLLESHEARLRELETLISSLKESPITIIKKGKK